MKEKLLIVMLIAIAAFTEFYPNVSAQDAANKAQQLIARARAALGSEKLKSLGAEGSYRRSLDGREMNGELTFEMILPDKMLKVETMRPFGDLEINRRSSRRSSRRGNANHFRKQGGVYEIVT